MEKEKTTAILVDVMNIYYSAKKLYNKKVNYQKLLDILETKGHDIEIAVAYLINKKSLKINSFEEMLTKTGFIIKKKIYDDSTDERKVQLINWNVTIALDLVSFSYKVDNVILVSGNKIFSETFPYINPRCKVHIMSFAESTSAMLLKPENVFYNLSNVEYTDLVSVGFKTKEEKIEKKETVDECPIDEIEVVNKHVDSYVNKTPAPSAKTHAGVPKWGMFQ